MTGTDEQFAERFPDIDVSTFVANQSTLADWTPTTSVLNEGLLSDIGRATIIAPDTQANFYARYIKAPLPRGDSAMTMRTGEVTSRAYNPNAPDTDLFNGQKASVVSNVAKKNLSRQIATEINIRYLKQMTQTQEMIGDLASSIMSASNVAYQDDMWSACKTYYTASLRGAKSDQIHVMSAKPTEEGFANEMNELIWQIAQNQFGYKSTNYNADGFNTKSTSVDIALTKSIEYRAFKKLYADTFHPDAIRVAQSIDYVDSFATPAGKPEEAGDLIGVIVDPRCYEIHPMPENLTVGTFVNGARNSVAYFTTYEYAMMDNPFFNKAFIFAPSEE